MEDQEQIKKDFKSALRIVRNTLSGMDVPFNVVDFYFDEENGVYAKIDIEGERFFVAPTTTSKIWIADFPIKNTEEKSLPPGFVGFPTEVAGIISKYYEEKPKGPFQNLTGIGTISLNEIVKEEVRKVFEDDYDYAEQEREYHNKKDYEAFEAQISSALSLMQDLHGSINRLKNQKELMTTDTDVDEHIDKAIEHINEAVKIYFEKVSLEVKDEVMKRLGEINIEK